MRGVLETSVGDTELSVDYTRGGYREKYNDPTLFYIHGLGCAAADFAGAVKEPLLSHMRRLSFNHPGCDDSPYPEGASLGTEELVTVANDLVVALNADPIVLVGHGFGGLVALRYAERYPENVMGLVNVEGNLKPQDHFLPRKIVSGEEDRDSLILQFSTSLNHGFKRYAHYLSRTYPRALKDYAASAVAQTDNNDLFGIFSELNMPKLFVCGSENIHSIDYLDELCDNGIKVVSIPGSNHFPAADNPEAYFRSIGEFITTLDTSD